MKENPLIINAHFQAAAGRESELGNALHALVAPSRAESGCLVYELHRDAERPGCFMLYEKFADQAAFDSHTKTPQLEAWRRNLDENPGLIATQTVTKWQSF